MTEKARLEQFEALCREEKELQARLQIITKQIVHVCPHRDITREERYIASQTQFDIVQTSTICVRCFSVLEVGSREIDKLASA